jgi:hypothetical protein
MYSNPHPKHTSHTDDPPEPESLEVDEDEAALDKAAAKAAAGQGEGQDEAYGGYDEYGQPYDEDGYYNGGEDALERWQAGGYGKRRVVCGVRIMHHCR